jgi:hypothetical protein
MGVSIRLWISRVNCSSHSDSDGREMRTLLTAVAMAPGGVVTHVALVDADAATPSA